MIKKKKQSYDGMYSFRIYIIIEMVCYDCETERKGMKYKHCVGDLKKLVT